MSEINPDIGIDTEKVKVHPQEMWTALQFLQVHGDGEDDGANFDVILKVRKSKLVYIGSPKATKTARFPMEYKGWTIEIKMGHKFKGARGNAVRNKRGYVASKPDDIVKTVKEFRPSYDAAPSLADVKRAIDVEEMSRRRKIL